MLTAAQVESLLDLDTAMESQRAAFTALGNRTAVLPNKLMVPGPDDSVALAYAARLSAETGPVCKLVSVNPANVVAGLPAISAIITALHPVTGRPVAVLDGTSITTIRTSAASAVAADVLSTPDSDDLAVLGCGIQGMAHVRAIATVRTLRRVRVWRRDAAACKAAATQLTAELGIEVEAGPDPQTTVDGARIVVTSTLSSEPVLLGRWLSPGTTVISVGSFEPNRYEVDAEVLERAAAVVVDDPDTAREHAGPVVAAIAGGRLGPADLIALGDVVVGTATARRSAADIVFYNSVGIGVQDAAAAWAVIAKAESAGLGTSVVL